MENEMRKLIDQVKNFGNPLNENKKTKYQISRDKENNRLLNLYPNIKFSPKWNNETLPRFMENDKLTFEEEYNKWKIYHTKNYLIPFEEFYKKYKPNEFVKSVKLIYQDEAKNQFDKIINGELYVDIEFSVPDSPIRNSVLGIPFDENTIKKASGNF
jgi:hypothetical protein